MKEDIKNILAGIWYVRGFILTFVGFVGYVVLACVGNYRLSLISLVLAFANIMMYLLYETGKNVRRKR